MLGSDFRMAHSSSSPHLLNFPPFPQQHSITPVYLRKDGGREGIRRVWGGGGGLHWFAVMHDAFSRVNSARKWCGRCPVPDSIFCYLCDRCILPTCPHLETARYQILVNTLFNTSDQPVALRKPHKGPNSLWLSAITIQRHVAFRHVDFPWAHKTKQTHTLGS